MITFRTSTNVTADRRVVLVLPPETPTGQAELVVTVSPAETALTEMAPGAKTSLPAGTLRNRFGTVRGRDPCAADNSRIDADLTRTYGDTHD